MIANQTKDSMKIGRKGRLHNTFHTQHNTTQHSTIQTRNTNDMTWRKKKKRRGEEGRERGINDHFFRQFQLVWLCFVLISIQHIVELYHSVGLCIHKLQHSRWTLVPCPVGKEPFGPYFCGQLYTSIRIPGCKPGTHMVIECSER